MWALTGGWAGIASLGLDLPFIPSWGWKLNEGEGSAGRSRLLIVAFCYCCCCCRSAFLPITPSDNYHRSSSHPPRVSPVKNHKLRVNYKCNWRGIRREHRCTSRCPCLISAVVALLQGKAALSAVTDATLPPCARVLEHPAREWPHHDLRQRRSV